MNDTLHDAPTFFWQINSLRYVSNNPYIFSKAFATHLPHSFCYLQFKLVSMSYSSVAVSLIFLSFCISPFKLINHNWTFYWIDNKKFILIKWNRMVRFLLRLAEMQWEKFITIWMCELSMCDLLDVDVELYGVILT